MGLGNYYWLFISIVFWGITKGFAGNSSYTIGGRPIAMGYTGIAEHSFYALYTNQAGTAFIEAPRVGLNADQRFMTSVTQLVSIAAALPTSQGTINSHLTYFGYAKYNNKKASLGFAKPFGENFAASVQLDYLSTYIKEQGTNRWLTFEAGMQIHILPELWIGSHVYNPLRMTLGKYANAPVPTLFKTGLSYQPTNQFVLNVGTEKSIDHSLRFKTGIEYNIYRSLDLRTGIITHPLLTCFGIGLEYRQLYLDLACTLHPRLGYSPHLSVHYKFNKTPNN